jgi:hypothetical protein
MDHLRWRDILGRWLLDKGRLAVWLKLLGFPTRAHYRFQSFILFLKRDHFFAKFVDLAFRLDLQELLQEGDLLLKLIHSGVLIYGGFAALDSLYDVFGRISEP